MQLQWTTKAQHDLLRLYEFLAKVNQPAAARAVQSLTVSPSSLLSNPALGKRLAKFDPREVRRILVGQYELHYEVTNSSVIVLRIWHTREDR